MPDMEKVIKALETCRKTDCANCEYNTEVCLIDEIISDALELLKEQRKQKFFVDAEGKITPLPIVFPNCPLKEQDAVEPQTQQSARGYWYTCGACGWRLFEVRDTVHFDDRKRIRYCASCGKMVKWE